MENNLKEIFRRNGIHYDEFAKITGISKARLYTYFNKEIEDFNLYEVTLLCSVLPIEPSYFGMDNNIFSFKKEKSEADALISFSYLKKTNRIKNYEDFLKIYFKALINEINKAKESIVILDYTGDNLYTQFKLEDFRTFQEYYEKFLQAITGFIHRKKEEDIENGVTSPKVVFTRILQCPINKISHTKNFHHKIDEVLDLSYESMFEQFESLWPEYKDYFKLCYVEKAFRPHSVMIIDNKNIITEYVRYNKELQPIPDILFADHKMQNTANDTANVLIESQLSDIERVINNDSNIISRKVAFLGLKDLENYYKNEKIKILNSKKYKKLEKSIKKQEEEVGKDNTSSRGEKESYLKALERFKDLKEKCSTLEERISFTKRKISHFLNNKEN